MIEKEENASKSSNAKHLKAYNSEIKELFFLSLIRLWHIP